MSNVLYVSYDGMLEPLGESQVVNYLERLAATHAITLLSYEKRLDLRDRPRLQAMAVRLRGAGIRWVRLRYHKRPSLLATAYDVLRGIVIGYLVCRRRDIELVHARGYVSSVIADTLKQCCGVKFLFDMRGFWPEEKVEAGHWSRTSLAYRLATRWEQRFFEQADAIVSLTQAGVNVFSSLGYTIPDTTLVEVIPTCADLTRFSPGSRDSLRAERLGLRGRTVIGCVGTLSNWYLREPTLAYLSLLVKWIDGASVLCVTREDHARLRADALAAGIPDEQLALARAEFGEMPAYLRLMDLGVFFITPCFSKQASAATKLAEFLATGIPVVINDGIGDSGMIVRAHGAGVVLPQTTNAAYEASLPQVMALLRDPERSVRCRRAAERCFDLQAGVQRYHALYERLRCAGDGRRAPVHQGQTKVSACASSL